MPKKQIRVVQTTNGIIRSIRCCTWTSFPIRENMSERLTESIAENKLNELNKKIVEIKKKIQLSGNGSNRTKHPSLIYTVSDNPPQVSMLLNAVTKLQSQILFLYRMYNFFVLLHNDKSFAKCFKSILLIFSILS